MLKIYQEPTNETIVSENETYVFPVAIEAIPMFDANCLFFVKNGNEAQKDVFTPGIRKNVRKFYTIQEVNTHLEYLRARYRNWSFAVYSLGDTQA